MATLTRSSYGDRQVARRQVRNILGRKAEAGGTGSGAVAGVATRGGGAMHIGGFGKTRTIGDRQVQAGIRADVTSLAIQRALVNVTQRRNHDGGCHRIRRRIRVATAAHRQRGVEVDVGDGRHHGIAGILVAGSAAHCFDRNVTAWQRGGSKTAQISDVAVGALTRYRVRCRILNRIESTAGCWPGLEPEVGTACIRRGTGTRIQVHTNPCAAFMATGATRRGIAVDIGRGRQRGLEAGSDRRIRSDESRRRDGVTGLACSRRRNV